MTNKDEKLKTADEELPNTIYACGGRIVQNINGHKSIVGLFTTDKPVDSDAVIFQRPLVAPWGEEFRGNADEFLEWLNDGKPELPQPQWRPISECPQIHGKRFLGWSQDIGEFVAEWFTDKWVYTWNQETCPVTKWQPLPSCTE